MLLYEVTATVPPASVEAFERYMRERHIDDVLATGAFERAVFTQIAPNRYRTSYEAASRIVLDEYLKEHAPRLRADFASHFPKGIDLVREIWTVVRIVEAGSDRDAVARMGMPDDRSMSPIACRMDAFTPAERTRRAEVLSILQERLLSSDETPDGILLRWSGDGESAILPLVGEFVSSERLCCPFIRFRIEVPSEGGPVELHLGGREGVKDFLVAIFMRGRQGT